VGSGPNIPRQRRRRRGREFTLSETLNGRLDRLAEAGENLSSLTEEALRAHPKINLPPEHEP
jgi:hypothetical protein